MKKEDLIQLKVKISELSEEEKIKRNLYLRDLSNGELQGPPVGYASIDKPWYKYYDKNAIVDKANVTNVYQNLYNNNKDNMDQVALMFFGANITYKKMFENIDKTAQALIANNVKKGDCYNMFGINTRSSIYVLCSSKNWSRCKLYVTIF